MCAVASAVGKIFHPGCLADLNSLSTSHDEILKQLVDSCDGSFSVSSLLPQVFQNRPIVAHPR